MHTKLVSTILVLWLMVPGALLAGGGVTGDPAFGPGAPIYVDKGTHNHTDLTQMAFGGADSTEYLPGQGIQPPICSLDGTVQTFTQTFGANHYTVDSPTQDPIQFGVAQPWQNVTATQATFFGGIVPHAQQYGMVIQNTAGLPNTLVCCYASYFGPPGTDPPIVWTWRYRPTPSMDTTAIQGTGTVSEIMQNVVLHKVTLSDASQKGVYARSLDYLITEGTAGAVGAMSNLRVYRDSGTTPGELDAGDVLLNSVLPTIAVAPAVTTINLDLDLNSRKVIGGSADFLIVADFNPFAFTDSRDLTVELAGTQSGVRSLVHWSDSNWSALNVNTPITLTLDGDPNFEILVDNGTLSRPSVGHLIYGGLDAGGAQYYNGLSLTNTTVTIAGTSTAAATILGANFYEGPEALSENDLFMPGNAFPFESLVGMTAITRSTGFDPSSLQEGLDVQDNSTLANTLVHVRGAYGVSDQAPARWVWRVRPESEAAFDATGLNDDIENIETNATLFRFDVTDSSQEGVFLDQITLHLTEIDLGALAAVSDVRIYRDNGSTPDVWDAGDTLVSETIATPTATTVVSTLAGVTDRRIIGGTSRYLVVANLDPMGYSPPRELQVDFALADLSVKSLLHGAAPDWTGTLPTPIERHLFFGVTSTNLVVDTLADTIDGDTSGTGPLVADPGPDGKISLREAITAMNNDPGTGLTIGFDPAVFNPGTIAVSGSALPAITHTGLILDGTGATVVIDGAALIGSESGLVWNASGGMIVSLEVRNFPVDGLSLGNSITSVKKSTFAANGRHGIFGSGTLSGSVIGSNDPSADNTDANQIDSNAVSGLALDGASVASIQFRGNSLFNNLQDGIDLLNGANGAVATPTLSSVVDTQVIGSGAVPNAPIDVYANLIGESQARIYRGSGVADGSGNFSFAVGTIQTGDRITVQQTTLTGASSELSAVVVATDTSITELTVNTVSDVLDGDTYDPATLVANPGPDGKISLREAITAINNDGSVLTIEFDPSVFIPGNPGVIQVTGTALPTVTRNGLIIDGTTGGVVLDGTNLIGSESGITWSTSSGEILGLTIKSFPQDGIQILMNSAATIGRLDGTGGNTVISNGRHGIAFVPAAKKFRTFFGSPQEVNLSKFKRLNATPFTGSGGSGLGGAPLTTIRGNWIGTDAGSAAHGNTDHGIHVEHEANATIGGDLPAHANVIGYHAGTLGAGIEVLDGTVRILGNLIGTDAVGADLANRVGVSVSGTPTELRLGEAGEGNVIGHSIEDQVRFVLTAASGAEPLSVRGNWIGTNASWTNLGGGGAGIAVDSQASQALALGGTAPGEGNYIVHSGGSGIDLVGTNAPVVQGNTIGVNDADVAMGNLRGITVTNLPNVLIGSADPSSDNSGKNTIARNQNYGILVDGASASNVQIRGNDLHKNMWGGIKLQNGANGGIAAPTGLDFVDDVLSGTAAPNATVDIYSNPDSFYQCETYIGTAVANGSGAFSLTVNSLELGSYYTAVQTTASGSSEISFAKWLQPITVEQDLPVMQDGVLDITGTAPEGATVRLVIDGVVVATTTADPQWGYFSFAGIDLPLIAAQTAVIEVEINGQIFTFEFNVKYLGHARVFDLDEQYRTENFIRFMRLYKLYDALDDFEGTVSPVDGEDYVSLGNDDANNVTQKDRIFTEQTVSNNNMNETESIGQFRQNIVHDDLGRVLSYEETKGGMMMYFRHTWNARDQLILVERSVDGQNYQPVSEYSYFADGMRATKKVYDAVGAAIESAEAYFGVGMMIHEVYSLDPADGAISAEPTKEFIYEGIDRPAVMFTDADGSATTGVMLPDDTVGGREAYFYHCNPRGDVYAITAGEDLTATSGFAAGEIVERYEYSLQGDTLVMNENYEAVYNGAPMFHIGNTVHSGNITILHGSGTHIDDEFSETDWQDFVMVGYILGVEIGGQEQYFILTGNYTKRTPDPTINRSTFIVAEDLAALGVQEGDPFTIYAPNTHSQIGNPHQWGGAWKDDETCYMWMRHRYYDSRMHGFMSRDPAEADVLGNLYAFGGNNFGTYVDPMGLARLGAYSNGGRVTIKGDGWETDLGSRANPWQYFPGEEKGGLPNAKVQIDSGFMSKHGIKLDEFRWGDLEKIAKGVESLDEFVEALLEFQDQIFAARKAECLRLMKEFSNVHMTTQIMGNWAVTKIMATVYVWDEENQICKKLEKEIIAKKCLAGGEATKYSLKVNGELISPDDIKELLERFAHKESWNEATWASVLKGLKTLEASLDSGERDVENLQYHDQRVLKDPTPNLNRPSPMPRSRPEDRTPTPRTYAPEKDSGWWDFKTFGELWRSQWRGR